MRAGTRSREDSARLRYPRAVVARTRKRPAPAPEPSAADEAAAYLRGLARRGKIAPAGTKPLPSGVTHVVDARKPVAKRIKRKRFS
jgi:hypothetical protein